MATLEYGTSHADVKDVQSTLNRLGYKIPVNGAYDDATAAALEDMCKKLKIDANPMKVDGKMWEALNYASEPRTLVMVNGKEAWVTKAQLAQLQKLASERALAAVQPLISMANEAQSMWTAHNQARDANWFWSGAVDIAVGTKFPSAASMAAAVKAAKGLEMQAKAGKLTPAMLNSYSATIRQAFADMDQYREELFGGGEELCKNLKIIQDGAVIVLQVTAAVATGGASWKVQVAVSAGVAAYEATLEEVNKASVDGSYSVETGVTNVFLAAAVDGTVGLILKGGKLGPFMDKVAKKATEEAGTTVLRKFIVNAINGGAQQMIEDGIKGLKGLTDPKKKFTMDDFVDAAVQSFVKGAGLKQLGKICEELGKKGARWLNPAHLGRFGKQKLNKAGEEGVKKVADVLMGAAIADVADGWDPKKKPSDFEQTIIDRVLKDPKLKAAYDKEVKAGNVEGKK
ncbi:MAG TPA: peptidoglycan-binding domain-containing protein [Paracoccaceae bacterium]|nr:peptidoglycan-binding domain-containing protein [Paracoccaceae bacterium]